MKKERVKELINEGYKIKVFTYPNKKYDKMILKTALIKNLTEYDSLYFVYYNHVKKFLNKNQLNFIETFQRVKMFTFDNEVDLYVKDKKNTLNKTEHESLTMLKSFRKMECLEQY